MRRPRRSFCALLLGLAILVPGGGRAESGPAAPVTIFAAASTSEAIEEVAAAFAARTGGSLRSVVAASSTLARQITQGAPADLFLSANVEWMDHLSAQQAIVEGSRVNLLSNRLVLVAPAGSTLRLRLSPELNLAGLLGGSRLAIGDPDHVPAGIYARQALEALGLWDQVADRLAPASNVRAALALVERGEVAAGIVYETDAAIAPKLRVVDAFPARVTPAIVYPLAIVSGRDTPQSRTALEFLAGEEAMAIFRKHGFTRPASGS